MVYRSQKKTQIRCWLVTLLFVGILCTICIYTSYVSLRLLQVVSIESTKGQDNDVKSGILNYWKWVYRTGLAEENKNIDKNGINHLNASHALQLPNHVIVCYYTISNELRPQWELNPSYVDPHICTHIIVGFARVVNCTLSLGETTRIYEEIVQLKYYEPNLKIMVSAGGMNEQEYGFPEMVKNHVNRKKFIRSVLKITKALKLDGLDLDWEFPAWLNNNKHQKVNFVQLIQELRKEFDHSGQELILSVAVAASQAIIDQSYDIPDIAPYVNFVNLMAYDYHFYQWYFPVTDLNSPLYARSTETGYLSSLNVNFSAHYWVAKGMPQEKLVIGIPTYGHSYHLANPANHNLHAPTTGIGNLGVDGFVQYSTVCQFLQQGAYRVFEIESRVPYAYKDLEWISYDDIDSVYYKVSDWCRFKNFFDQVIINKVIVKFVQTFGLSHIVISHAYIYKTLCHTQRSLFSASPFCAVIRILPTTLSYATVSRDCQDERYTCACMQQVQSSKKSAKEKNNNSFFYLCYLLLYVINSLYTGRELVAGRLNVH